eukprot:CAMPEP_0113566006 /NCGR_PEP_ID=MMETSP0015_2-20120614/22488_1 /TAXON_ID=2838 /ORGANISM="Odontella" /LENGTH=359 /DNA_ID=CAMNT_0000468257 /DNA_START=35 /DNA_END=1110 /DNA_ORIENTATION=+ /assembly_acc=CAM_ASM_000160
MPQPRHAHRAAALAAGTIALIFSPAAVVVDAFHHRIVARGSSAASRSILSSRSIPPIGGGGLSDGQNNAGAARNAGRPSTILSGWFGGGGGSDAKSKSKSSAAAAAAPPAESIVQVGEHVGSGSYGTVHVVSFETDGMIEDELYIGKRPWTYDELREKASEAAKEAEEKAKKADGEDGDEEDDKKMSSSSGEGKWMESDASIKERAERCKYYVDVERHCLNKLNDLDDEMTKTAREECITDLIGTHMDDEGREWLVFKFVPRGTGYGESSDDDASDDDSEPSKPALSLSDAMELDWADQHAQDPTAGELQHHHLYIVQREMGLPSDSTFADTLDAVLRGLLRAIVACHSGNVVHRDVKP